MNFCRNFKSRLNFIATAAFVGAVWGGGFGADASVAFAENLENSVLESIAENNESAEKQNAAAPFDLSVLPIGAQIPAETTPHFPNRTAAFVWRNWNLAPIEKLAETLNTRTENIAQIADFLGLPPYKAPTWEADRVYITLTRRNWSILPYEQLLTLLGIAPAEFAEKLREDDFLWVKLGSLKPICEPLAFEEPTAADVAAMKKIAADVRKILGDEAELPEEPRFAFLDELTRVDAPTETAQNSSESVAKMESCFKICYLHSYFAVFGDPLLQDDAKTYPDGLLQKLSERGVNGVWLHSLLRDLAPPINDFPEFGKKSEIRRATLRNLVNRAKKYGIDVYLYMNEPRAMPAAFFAGREGVRGVAEGEYCAMCASTPEVRRWLGDSLAFLFADVPGLGGIFTISGSENLTTCVSHGGQAGCPRCSEFSDAELIADLNATMAEGVWRSAPDAKVIVWDWGWRGHGLATDIIEKLPKNVWLQSVSEWALPLNRGGVATEVGEYSISAVGPGPRALAHWEAAKKAGIKTIAKCQFNTTWECASVPTIPAVDLVARHASRLAKSGVDGVMAGWSLGGFPAVNLEVLQEFSANPNATEDEVLDRLAARFFGEEGAKLGRDGWTKISAAFEEFPYAGSVVYTAPNQIGPANPLRLEKSAFRATMVGIPYDDLNSWRGPYPPEIFASQMEKTGRGFVDGAAELKKAAAFAPEARRVEAERQARCAEAAGTIFLSCANQARFVVLRDERAALLENSEKTENSARLAEVEAAMIASARDEIALAKTARRLAMEDSCLGFESTNHYWTVPNDFVEKIVSCLNIIAELEK